MSPLIDIRFYKDYVPYTDHPVHVEWVYQIAHEIARQKAAKAAIIIQQRLFDRVRPEAASLINKDMLAHILPEEVPINTIGRKTVIKKIVFQQGGIKPS